ETMSLLGNHFPERLGVAFCVDPPFYFQVFWRVRVAFLLKILLPHTQRRLYIHLFPPQRQRKFVSSKETSRRNAPHFRSGSTWINSKRTTGAPSSSNTLLTTTGDEKSLSTTRRSR